MRVHVVNLETGMVQSFGVGPRVAVVTELDELDRKNVEAMAPGARLYGCALDDEKPGSLDFALELIAGQPDAHEARRQAPVGIGRTIRP